ncbi:MAG: MBL fold metallo-hydrolase [Spirochaetales bacterium]|nr:MBL fold metallo-hydrolase [Spirochaetales bacterium]
MIPSKDLTIVTLCENTVSGRDLLGEWGLSFSIRTPDTHLLFDTGAGSAGAANADVLKVDLSDVQGILLSHGHFDHLGGLPAMVRKTRKRPLPVFGHPDIFVPKYSRKGDRVVYAGPQWAREEAERLGAEFQLSKDPVRFHDDIILSGEEPRVTDFEFISDKLLVLDNHGKYVGDPMKDDQSLFLVTDLGLVVLLGCAHRGMINILRYAVEITGVDRVHMVVGGTHLMAAGDEQIEKSIQALRDMRVEWVGVSHCTGGYAAVKLASAFKDHFFFNHTGTRITFPFNRPV